MSKTKQVGDTWPELLDAGYVTELTEQQVINGRKALKELTMDTTTKHTKGPWKALNPNNGESVYLIQSDSRIVGALRGAYSDADEKLEVDAVLIAAAPEMLEALETSLKLLNEASEIHGFRNAVHNRELEKLINKAKGE